MTPCLSKELWPALYIYMHLFEPFKKTAFVVVLAIVKTEKTHEKKKKKLPKFVKYGSILNFPPHYDHVSQSCYLFVHLLILG